MWSNWISRAFQLQVYGRKEAKRSIADMLNYRHQWFCIAENVRADGKYDRKLIYFIQQCGSASNIWSFPCQADLQVVLGGNRPHSHQIPAHSPGNSLHIQEEANEDETNYHLQIEIAFWSSSERICMGGIERGLIIAKKCVNYIRGCGATKCKRFISVLDSKSFQASWMLKKSH